MKQILLLFLLLNALWFRHNGLFCKCYSDRQLYNKLYRCQMKIQGTYIIAGGYCGSKHLRATGPEKTYRFTLTQTSTISLKIADLTDDLDLSF